ncbi:MAG: hypothetical protein M3O89_06070 [Actinomycetota bacterium]|nr:hypothetical protein [Actinomycetota bacterium]
MGRRFITLASMALLALTLATGATATHAALAPVTEFTDAAGDSGTAADITTVDVTNDDLGQYLVDVSLATSYGGAEGMSLFLDTDMNAATGDPQFLGSEYQIIDDNAANSFYFLMWNGTSWVDSPTNSTIKDSVSTDGKDVLLSVNKSEIGNSTGFNFFVVSLEGDGSDGHWDAAPEGTASWPYKLQNVLKLSLVAAKSFAVKAGGTWDLAVIVGRSDTGGTVGPEGTLVCSATSGSTKLKLAGHSFISGGSGKPTAAVCSFKVPKSLKHKVLHATVTVSYQGQTVKHSFTATAK